MNQAVNEPSSILQKTSLKREVGVLGTLLALSIILMFYTFWVVNSNDAHDKQYVSISSELRAAARSIPQYAYLAVEGDSHAVSQLVQLKTQFDQSLTQLHSGDPIFKLPPSPVELQNGELRLLQETWVPIKRDIEYIVSQREFIETVSLSLETLDRELRDFPIKQVALISVLEQKNLSSAKQVVEQQKKTLEQINLILHSLLHSKLALDKRSSDLLSNIELIFQQQTQLTDNSGVAALLPTNALIQQQKQSFEDIGTVLRNLQAVSYEREIIASLHQSSQSITTKSSVLANHATALHKRYVDLPDTRFIGAWAGYIWGAFALTFLAWLSFKAYSNARVTLAKTASQHKANRAAVWRLLDELANLADGDLTVHATVGDDITGAIAESVNYAIDALRKLVFTINGTAMQVSAAAQETQTVAENLANANEMQAAQINEASLQINSMARSIEEVSANASESTEVAGNALNIAKNGADVVKNTMSGMDKIRDQIQQTSKQIKRLGESTQEIGNIVSIIDDITDQTNILALNSAIQAAMAGEAGRGFAVVAEEVQRLAERSSQATKQIESLVKNIQSQTNETVYLMEQTTSEVVQGAKLAQDAGAALEQIEAVSAHMADLVQRISYEAHQQALSSNSVTETMSVIQGIAQETVEGTTRTAESIGDLTELAISLRDSVAGFKLPPDAEKAG